jgi:hypothetical protein
MALFLPDFEALIIAARRTAWVSAATVATTLSRNARSTKTPILALEEWQNKRPEPAVKRAHAQNGLDT